MTNNEHKQNFGEKLEAIKHIGDWINGELVCRPDCPSTCHSQPSVAEDISEEDGFIRDVTRAGSIPKSEVREKLERFTSLAYAQGQQDERERVVGIIENEIKEKRDEANFVSILAAIHNDPITSSTSIPK